MLYRSPSSVPSALITAFPEVLREDIDHVRTVPGNGLKLHGGVGRATDATVPGSVLSETAAAAAPDPGRCAF